MAINHTARFETVGDLYYRHSGRLRPGKSEPMATGRDSSSPENRAAFDEWCAMLLFGQALDRIAELESEVANTIAAFDSAQRQVDEARLLVFSEQTTIVQMRDLFNSFALEYGPIYAPIQRDGARIWRGRLSLRTKLEELADEWRARSISFRAEEYCNKDDAHAMAATLDACASKLDETLAK